MSDAAKSYYQSKFWSRAIASVAVCAAGAFCMYITNGSTGIGWAILGLMIIW